MAQAFSPDGQRQLADGVRTARVRDDLAPLGKLSSLELVPAAGPSGESPFRREAFTAVFAGGSRRVDVTFDAAGKIAAFWVH